MVQMLELPRACAAYFEQEGPDTWLQANDSSSSEIGFWRCIQRAATHAVYSSCHPKVAEELVFQRILDNLLLLDELPPHEVDEDDDDHGADKRQSTTTATQHEHSRSKKNHRHDNRSGGEGPRHYSVSKEEAALENEEDEFEMID